MNRFDEIVHTCDSNSIDGNKLFISVKQIDKEKFDTLWKVMNRDEYDTKLKNLFIIKPSSEGYQWWEEDKSEIDEVLSGKDGLG